MVFTLLEGPLSWQTNLLLLQNKIFLIVKVSQLPVFKATDALSPGAKLTTNLCRHHEVMTLSLKTRAKAAHFTFFSHTWQWLGVQFVLSVL